MVDELQSDLHQRRAATSITRGAIAIAVLSSSLGLVGCSNTAAGVEEDATRVVGKATEAADDASRASRRAATAAVETIDVKSALMADRSVDASRIDVDTFPETKTIVLKGSVKTATQRDAAAPIAAIEAREYQVDNQLKVVPNPAYRQYP